MTFRKYGISVILHYKAGNKSYYPQDWVMSKIMTLELLSSITGAKSSDAVDKLFMIINKALPVAEDVESPGSDEDNVILSHDLREDIIIECSEPEKRIIRDNFPKKKNSFLVVSRVIET